MLQIVHYGYLAAKAGHLLSRLVPSPSFLIISTQNLWTPIMSRRSPTTKDVALLHQLFADGQLTLAPEFQRNAIWPRAAKAYLIDTIINDKPIPLLFFQRTTSAQSGRPAYSVIDGQQRLRAIFEFLDDRFPLSESTKRSSYYNKRFSELNESDKTAIRNYDLSIAELSGYTDDDIKDMFIRMNKYVVQLSPQELRHAQGEGKFHDFVEKLGQDSFWRDQRVFSKKMLLRMRAVEFSAELAILLIEGPQDKKSSVELYYKKYQKKFPESNEIENQLREYLRWIAKAIPELKSSRYRKPVDLYALVGALDRVSEQGKKLSKLNAITCGERLVAFEEKTKLKDPPKEAQRYLAAASRQTDNLTPRTTRIDALAGALT